MAKCPPVRNSTGGFPKDRFRVDLDAKEVTCPAGHSAPIRMSRKGGGRASFAPHCHGCPLRAGCTSGPKGRSIAIGPHEKLLQAARAEQTTQRWARRYRADRPVVERKIAHFVRRVWGGRQARARGRERVATDLDTRAAAINWSRLARLGLGWGFGGWALTS